MNTAIATLVVSLFLFATNVSAHAADTPCDPQTQRCDCDGSALPATDEDRSANEHFVLTEELMVHLRQAYEGLKKLNGELCSIHFAQASGARLTSAKDKAMYALLLRNFTVHRCRTRAVADIIFANITDESPYYKEVAKIVGGAAIASGCEASLHRKDT